MQHIGIRFFIHIHSTFFRHTSNFTIALYINLLLLLCEASVSLLSVLEVVTGGMWTELCNNLEKCIKILTTTVLVSPLCCLKAKSSIDNHPDAECAKKSVGRRLTNDLLFFLATTYSYS